MFFRESIAATGRGRSAAWTAAVALCALAAAGCAPSEGPPGESAGRATESADTVDPTSSASRSAAPAPSVVDDGGRAVSLAAPPRRIVSLIPAVTEMLIALGAGDRLVARTDYDTNPALDTLPSVGGGLTPDIEWLVRRQPDLVIGWTDGTARTVLGRLRELGIGVYSADIQSLADADTTVLRLGALLRLDDEAEALVARTRRGLDEVRRAARGLPRPRVLYVLSVDPPMTAGPGTFLHEIIELAGGDNVFGDAAAQWPTVSLEAVVDREPDLLLVPVGEEGFVPVDRLGALPGWANLAAVRAGRVHPVDADRFHRPGPPRGDVARELMRIYYPGLDEDRGGAR